MSESHVNHNSQNQNPPAAGNAPAGSTPPKPTAQTQNSPETKSAATASTATANHASQQAAPSNGVQFQSGQIGTHTAKQYDAFAEHKQKAATKKEKANKARRLAIIIAGVIAALAAIGLIIYMIISIINKKPEPEAPAIEEPPLSTSLLEEAREIANKKDATPEEVESFFEGAFASSTDPVETDQIRLAQFLYYFNLPDAQKATEISALIKADNLPNEDKVAYYSALSQIYHTQGNEEQANHYSYQSYLIMLELAGTEEEGNEP